MKVYVVMHYWKFDWKLGANVRGIFQSQEDAIKCLIDVAEEDIKPFFKEDECWYNEDHHMFTAYRDKTSDEENLEIIEKELDKNDYNKQ